MTKVIWNASAGRRALSLARLDEAGVAALLQKAGLDYEICPTNSAEQAEAIARAEVAAGASLVVAAGGDGTIGTVARVLLKTDVALAMLPLGSVMNVPRMLGVPRDANEAARIIARGFRRTIDVGEANGRLFYETASVGIERRSFARRRVSRTATSAACGGLCATPSATRHARCASSWTAGAASRRRR